MRILVLSIMIFSTNFCHAIDGQLSKFLVCDAQKHQGTYQLMIGDEPRGTAHILPQSQGMLCCTTKRNLVKDINNIDLQDTEIVQSGTDITILDNNKTRIPIVEIFPDPYHDFAILKLTSPITIDENNLPQFPSQEHYQSFDSPEFRTLMGFISDVYFYFNLSQNPFFEWRQPSICNLDVPSTIAAGIHLEHRLNKKGYGFISKTTLAKHIEKYIESKRKIGLPVNEFEILHHNKMNRPFDKYRRALREFEMCGTKSSYLELGGDFCFLPPLKPYRLLKVLTLINSNLTSLQQLEEIPQLTDLNIENTLVSSVEDLSPLVNLQTLRLINNPIDDLSPLLELPKLKTLYLSLGTYEKYEVVLNALVQKGVVIVYS